MSDYLAQRLWAARTGGGTVPLAAGDVLTGAEDAYAVQRASAALAGLPRAGWKVATTSAAAQRLLDTPEPATAPMFQPLCFESPAEIAIFEGQSTSVESEFAVRFDRPLPPRDTAYSRAEVLAAVGALFAAIEVVACRFAGGFAGLGGVRLIADMAANLAWVRGAETSDWRGRDLRSHPVVLSKNGETVAEGNGAQVLGDPLNVMEWTANHLSGLGDGISAGEVVSTGTCTGVVPVAPGDTLIANFADLGEVEVRFHADTGVSSG